MAIRINESPFRFPAALSTRSLQSERGSKSMGKTKVYGRTACSYRAVVTLLEKGVSPEDIEVVDINLVAGEHKRPEYLKLNPFAEVPVLQDGTFTLFESRAIARYAADKYEHQGTPLYGYNERDRAYTEQWLEVEAQYYHPPINVLIQQLVICYFYGRQPNEQLVDENLEKLGKVLDIYEQQLAKHKYLAGDFLSLADLVHIPYAYFLIQLAKRPEPFTARNRVNDWIQGLVSLPSWKKTWEMAAPRSL